MLLPPLPNNAAHRCQNTHHGAPGDAPHPSRFAPERQPAQSSAPEGLSGHRFQHVAPVASCRPPDAKRPTSTCLAPPDSPHLAHRHLPMMSRCPATRSLRWPGPLLAARLSLATSTVMPSASSRESLLRAWSGRQPRGEPTPRRATTRLPGAPEGRPHRRRAARSLGDARAWRPGASGEGARGVARCRPKVQRSSDRAWSEARPEIHFWSGCPNIGLGRKLAPPAPPCACMPASRSRASRRELPSQRPPGSAHGQHTTTRGVCRQAATARRTNV